MDTLENFKDLIRKKFYNNPDIKNETDVDFIIQELGGYLAYRVIKSQNMQAAYHFDDGGFVTLFYIRDFFILEEDIPHIQNPLDQQKAVEFQTIFLELEVASQKVFQQ